MTKSKDNSLFRVLSLKIKVVFSLIGRGGAPKGAQPQTSWVEHTIPVSCSFSFRDIGLVYAGGQGAMDECRVGRL